MKDSALWERIQSFRLDDPGAGLSFSTRLARENGWSEAFTAEILQEYRRFLHLCATAGHAVTPSDAVDQAWHLHLCYTRSYWQDLCRDTLGFQLHHGPTKGGRDEEAKYSDWYARTLESYREIFGEEPPASIWPPAEVRFARRDFRRIDATSHFIVRKRHVAALAIGTGLGLALASCATHFASTQGDGTGFLFVGIIIFLVFISIYISK